MTDRQTAGCCIDISPEHNTVVSSLVQFRASPQVHVTHQGSQGGLVQRRVALHRHVWASSRAQVRRDGLDVQSRVRNVLCHLHDVFSARSFFFFFVFLFVFFQRSLSLKSLSETSSELSEDKVSSGVWRAYFLGRLLFCSVVKALTERALSPTGGRWQLFEQRIPTERCKPRPSPSVPHRLLPALIQSAPLCGKTQNSVRV